MSKNETDQSDADVAAPAEGSEDATDALDALHEENSAAPVEQAEAAVEEEATQAPDGDEIVFEDAGGSGTPLPKRVMNMVWPSTWKARAIRLAIPIVLGGGAIAWFLLPPSAPTEPAGPQPGKVVKPDSKPVDVTEVKPEPLDTNPNPVITVPSGESGVQQLIERGELAMRNKSWPEALQLLEQALRMVPSTERVMRGRVFEGLAKVNREMGKDSQARIFSERAKQLLREIFEPAHLIEAAEGKIAIGQFRAAQQMFSRFLLLTGSLEGEALALKQRAERGLARALEAEWRSTRDPRSLDRLPEPSLDFGERR